MKTVFLVDNLAAGGAGRVVARLASEFAKRGEEVIVTTMSNNILRYELNEKVSYLPLYEGEKIPIIDKVKKLRYLCVEHKTNILISFLSELNIYAIMASLGMKWKVIVSERNDPHLDPPEKKVRLLRTLLYRFADGYVFQTKDAKDYFSTRIRSKSTIIFNPVPECLPDKWGGKRRKAIVSAGRLVAQKNFFLLVNSFANVCTQFPEFTLEIYGEGPLRNDLEKIIKEKRLEKRVLLMGQEKELLLKINDAYLFVLSSNYEGMSNALLEALALGLPVISTNHPIGGAKELIRDDNNGILVPVNDERKMTEAIKRMLMNEENANRIGENAFLLRSELSIISIVDQWFEYIKVIQER